MRGLTTSLLIAASVLCLGSTTVFGGDGLTITINNNTTSSLLVSVYDRNVSPPQKVLSSEVVNGFASISVSITADDRGRGHLSWTATTPGHDMRRCGHRDKPNLNDGDTVHVYANADCRAGT